MNCLLYAIILTASFTEEIENGLGYVKMDKNDLYITSSISDSFALSTVRDSLNVDLNSDNFIKNSAKWLDVGIENYSDKKKIYHLFLRKIH